MTVFTLKEQACLSI